MEGTSTSHEAEKALRALRIYEMRNPTPYRAQAVRNRRADDEAVPHTVPRPHRGDNQAKGDGLGNPLPPLQRRVLLDSQVIRGRMT